MADKSSQTPPTPALDYVTLGDSHVYAVLGTVTGELPPVTLTIAARGFAFHDYLTPEDAKQLAAALLEQANAATRGTRHDPMFDQATLDRVAQAKVAEAGRERAVIALRYHDTITLGERAGLGRGFALNAGTVLRVEWPADVRDEIGLSLDGGDSFMVPVEVLAKVPFTVTDAPTNEPF